MRKLSRKSGLLFIGVMAVCAFVMPSMASAASWVLDTGTFPSTHIFDSPNPDPTVGRLSFAVAALGAGSTCGIAQFDTTIASSSDARVNGAGFQNCMGTGGAVNCTVTVTGTRFPWTITNPATNNVIIDGVHVDATFENTPGASPCPAPFNGATVTLTGNLNSGLWNQTTGREITFVNATGLFAHVIGTSNPATVSGTLADTTAGLTLRN